MNRIVSPEIDAAVLQVLDGHEGGEALQRDPGLLAVDQMNGKLERLLLRLLVVDEFGAEGQGCAGAVGDR